MGLGWVRRVATGLCSLLGSDLCPLQDAGDVSTVHAHPTHVIVNMSQIRPCAAGVAVTGDDGELVDDLCTKSISSFPYRLMSGAARTPPT